MTHIGPASDALEPIERVTLVAYLLYHLRDLDSSVGDPQQAFELTINQGESAAAVVSQLEASGLVQDGTLLRNYLRYRGLDISIEAGGYLLTGDMTVREIAEALQRAEVRERSFTVVEGWRREQIAQALEDANLGIQSADFLRSSSFLPAAYSSLVNLPQSASLEGLLFPDTYSLDADISAEELVLSMLKNFDQRVTEELRQEFTNQGLSLYQAVTLASIVEREARVADERALIASVFLNRLSLGMKLEADPTVQYAMGQQPDGGWWKAPLSLEDLEIDSLYNTYLYYGLSVGPICNPGLDSLRAVAFPVSTSYLYFRASCDGSGRHSFAESFEEHQMNACQ
ncbi:MAG: hypothetical protein A2Z14_02990 [Chloroflexi bacterium RBG_16_48_8]|nr:MAG: hypothetical protein A2Z14_02990 [Chloroflexi bacterium RBG_16_48_8]